MTTQFHDGTLQGTAETGHDLPAKSAEGAAFAPSDWGSGFFCRLDMIERSHAVLTIDDLGVLELSVRHPEKR